MFSREAGLILVALCAGTATAHAASGSISDPKGDYPDIVKLAYDNARSKVVMTTTYAGDGQNGRAQNESFYMRWGSSKPKYYQVFLSPQIGMEELRYSGSAGEVSCRGLVVKHPTRRSTKVTVPRSCLDKAPNKLRFQAIATEGLASEDETKISKRTARG
jgi:hypothetical protein